jgi:A/G-specific adenine glycosylase
MPAEEADVRVSITHANPVKKSVLYYERLDSKTLRWFRNRLVRWYLEKGRKFPWRTSRATLYTKILSEVLLQRTTAAAIAAFLPDFTARYPSWSAIGNADLRELEDALRPIGLWRRRALSLHALAKELTRRGGRFPKARAEIDELPGVGQYIGNAVELFVHNSRRPLLDVNMARVLERFFGPRRLADIRYDPYLQFMAHKLVAIGDAKIINWAILDFASVICKRPIPLCGECFLRAKCAYYNLVVLHAPTKGRRRLANHIDVAAVNAREKLYPIHVNRIPAKVGTGRQE